jgi:predicted RND superfamily exporter protein
MGALIFDLILQILLFDFVKAVASFVAVFFYLRYMLGSWFLTAVGMFEIVMSLPLAWITFSYIFQIKYFSALNSLCLFIVMAIGADDIFVFMDAYKRSASKGPEVLSSLETRMSWVYRRSGSAMFLTTTTTCCAFLCTLISPIAGTRSFGIFAAFVILFDYLLVMTLFCTSVIIYHNRLENKPYCCNCSFWRKCDPTPTEAALKRCEDGEPPHVDRISKFFQVSDTEILDFSER